MNRGATHTYTPMRDNIVRINKVILCDSAKSRKMNVPRKVSEGMNKYWFGKLMKIIRKLINSCLIESSNFLSGGQLTS